MSCCSVPTTSVGHIGQIQCKMYLESACVVSVASCPIVCPLVSSSPCDFVHLGSGAHFHCCPPPCSSTLQWAQRSQPTDSGDRSSVQSVFSCPHQPGDNRMCVIAKRLGCLRWLAHAAGHGIFLGASTSRRSVSFVCSHQKTTIQKMTIIA